MTEKTFEDLEDRSFDIKGEDFYDNSYYDNLPFARGEVSLYRGVVMQALIDCYTLSKRTEDQNARLDAFSWFSLQNDDFLTVCSYADMDPNYVLRKAKEAIAKGCAWRQDERKERRLAKRNYNKFTKNIISLNPELFRRVI